MPEMEYHLPGRCELTYPLARTNREGQVPNYHRTEDPDWLLHRPNLFQQRIWNATDIDFTHAIVLLKVTHSPLVTLHVYENWQRWPVID